MAMHKCLFAIWQTKEVLELFQYIKDARNAGDDLHIAGFDIQDWSLSEEITQTLKETLAKREPSLLQDLQDTEEKLAIWRRRKILENEETALNKVYEHLAYAAVALADQSANDKVLVSRLKRLARVMHSRMTLVHMLSLKPGERARLEIRDKAMSDNLAFLAAPSSRKIIVWAHNAHVSRSEFSSDGPRQMGDWMHQEFGSTLYAIGLVMGKGSATFNNRKLYQILPPDPSTVEGIMHNRLFPISFVDFSRAELTPANEWMFSKIYTREWGIRPIPITPKRAFDGLLYIDTVTPPDYIQ